MRSAIPPMDASSTSIPAQSGTHSVEVTHPSPVNDHPLSNFRSATTAAPRNAQLPLAAQRTGPAPASTEDGRAAMAARFGAIFKEREQLQPEVLRRLDVAAAPPPAGQGLLRLARTPVYLATVDKGTREGVTSRSHGFAVVGHPGQGNRSGLAYYSISGDHTRGGVDVDEAFLGRVAGRTPALEPAVQEAVRQLQGGAYLAKEHFHQAYACVRRERAPEGSAPSDVQIAGEVKALLMQIPEEKFELWLREPNGLKTASGAENRKPNMAERDLRHMENLQGTDLFTGRAWSEMSAQEKQSGNTIHLQTASLRCLPGADPLKLLDAKRQNLLHRTYVDELLDRNGTMLPTEAPASAASPEERTARAERAAAALPTYQLYPPYPANAGNCNTGVAALLRAAGQAEADIKAPSEFAFGLHKDLTPWDPLRGVPASPPAASSQIPPGSVDDSPIRGRLISTAALNEHLMRRQSGPERPL